MAPEITARLMGSGLTSDTSVLVAANINLPDSLLLRTRLELRPLAAKTVDLDAPVLLLIESAIDVCAMLQWRRYRQLLKLSHSDTKVGRPDDFKALQTA